jgi:hypothetical protein
MRGPSTTRSAADARRQLLPAAVAATPPSAAVAATPLSKARAIARSAAAARRREVAIVAATPLPATVAITRSATAARRREVVVVAATPSSAAVAASPPSTAGVITRSATAARRREAEVEACTCVSDLARYIEFLQLEEERLVEHAQSLSAIMATAHADAEARNQEIYEDTHRFERGRLERQRVFEVSVAKGAAAAGTVLQLSSLSVGSSSSSSY